MILGLFNIPTFLAAALNFAAPILTGLIQFGGWYLSELWNGIKIILANLSTLVVLATVALISGYYSASTFKKAVDCPKPSISKTSKPSTWDPFGKK